jgi:hypothetical protein
MKKEYSPPKTTPPKNPALQQTLPKFLQFEEIKSETKGTNKTIRTEEETQATSIAASDDDHSST